MVHPKYIISSIQKPVVKSYTKKLDHAGEFWDVDAHSDKRICDAADFLLQGLCCAYFTPVHTGKISTSIQSKKLLSLISLIPPGAYFSGSCSVFSLSYNCVSVFTDWTSIGFTSIAREIQMWRIS